MAEEEEVQIEEEEETEAPRYAHDPLQPTARQIAEHRVNHIPYRTWCQWCVLGRGRGQPHKRTPGSTVPVIGLDYFFITPHGVKSTLELAEWLKTDDPITTLPEDPNNTHVDNERRRGGIVKCIMVRDSLSKCIFAHVIPYKGNDDSNQVADMVLSDVEWLGYSRLIFKTDGEPAIQAFVKRVIELAKVEIKTLDQVGQEHSPAYDSQSNGSTEIGIQLVRGLFRTVRLCLEERLGKSIPPSHAITSWLLEHIAMTYNAMVKGDDGLTAWGRARGKSFRQQLVGFGECVLYRHPNKGPNHAPDGNMGTLGGEGVFLGHNRTSNTFVVGTEGGSVVETRSITRRPERQRWNAERLAAVQALPSHGKKRQEADRVRLPDEPRDATTPTETGKPSPIRRMRIAKVDLDRYGYNAACPQCKYIQRYGQPQPGKNHSEPCRKQLEEAMSKTPDGQARLASHEQRLDRRTAEHVEHADQRAQQHVAAPAAATAAQAFEERRPEHATPTPAPRRQPAEPHPIDAAIPTTTRVPRSDPRTNDPANEPAIGVEGAIGAPPEEPLGETPAYQEDRDDENMEESTDVNMDFVGSMEVHDVLGCLEPSIDDTISHLLLAQMGSSGRSYRRDTATAAKKLVSEIYSPPRVTALIRQIRSKHFLPGYAFDLTTVDPADGKPWDFSIAAKRERARALLREQKPYLLIGSPMCTAFSTWQRLNWARSNDRAGMARAYAEAVVHMRFVAELYAEQSAGGRYFLHEHPAYASSWQLECIADVMKLPNVQRVTGDQCMYGAEIQSGPDRGEPINKPTGFMTNSDELAQVLCARCSGQGGMCSRPAGGKHIPCAGKHAKEAAKYPRGLCKAIHRGIRNQLRADDLLKNGCFGVQVPDDDAEVEKSFRGPAQG